jgi:membrane protein implicated in regulation of membrane protease activity
MQLFEWPSVGWLALALVAAIVEVSTPHFGFVFVSVAAVVAAAVAAFNFGSALQIAMFAVTLVATLVLIRPHLTSRLGSRGVPSRTEVLIGRDALVTQAIDPLLGAGRVNVGGEDWAARSRETLDAGTRVRVVGADGIVLEVRRA